VETTADDFFVQLASRNRFREEAGHAGEATAPLFFEGVGSGG